MFDSVLTGGNVPKSRFGLGAIISIVVHVALMALVVFLSTRPPEEKKEDAEVKFFAAAPAPAPPPPPPPPASKPKTTKTEKKTIKKPDQIIQPKEIPQEKPKEAEPEPEEEGGEPEEAGVEGGVVGGVAGGVVGGVVGGQLGGSLGGTGPEVLPFGEGMSRPVGDKGNRPPQYTREALEARIEGLMLVKCTITTEGELKNCRVIKPLPHMDRAVLEALSKWKFAPVTFQGRAVAVDYVIPVRLIIPR